MSKFVHASGSALMAAGIAIMLCACQTTQKTPIDDASTLEGLVEVDVTGFGAVYRKPKASLANYTKLIIRPARVEFSKNWERNLDSALYQMNKPDRDKLTAELAEEFSKVFRQELETNGHYQIVTEPAADVLEVRPSIVNLYVNAPDVSMRSTYRIGSYTTDAGEMTLICELHDSITGELLTRAYDRQVSSSTSTWQWTNSITNDAEAQRIIGTWAVALRDALDASRGKSQ